MTNQELRQNLEKTVEFLSSELGNIHTGRASASLVDGIEIESYGQRMPVKQVANISVPDPRSISIQPWDKGNLQVIEKAIRDSDLGLSPVNDGNVVRINIPELTEERRKEYVKVAKEKAEDARIALRNLRRDFLDFYKRQKNEGIISENDLFTKEKEAQTIIDEYNKKIDEVFSKKEKELLSV